jgi:hypothetical protein
VHACVHVPIWNPHVFVGLNNDHVHMKPIKVLMLVTRVLIEHICFVGISNCFGSPHLCHMPYFADSYGKGKVSTLP